jgi:hypothetical protein
MDILYYSTNCTHSQKLLQYLAKNGLSSKMNFLSVDRRTVDPVSGQTYLILDRGTKVMLPPNVQAVPSLVLINQNFRVLSGAEIYGHLTPKLQDMTDRATGNNGEPLGYQIGGGDIVSERFTDYGMSPEELSSKGRGGMRQMHNYVPAAHSGFSIPTPKDDYKSDKVGEVDMESLQQKRNADVTNATKNMPLIEINHQSYTVPTPRGPPPVGGSIPPYGSQQTFQTGGQSPPYGSQHNPPHNNGGGPNQSNKAIPAHYFTLGGPNQNKAFPNSYLVNI